MDNKLYITRVALIDDNVMYIISVYFGQDNFPFENMTFRIQVHWRYLIGDAIIKRVTTRQNNVRNGHLVNFLIWYNEIFVYHATNKIDNFASTIGGTMVRNVLTLSRIWSTVGENNKRRTLLELISSVIIIFGLIA